MSKVKFLSVLSASILISFSISTSTNAATNTNTIISEEKVLENALKESLATDNVKNLEVETEETSIDISAEIDNSKIDLNIEFDNDSDISSLNESNITFSETSNITEEQTDYSVFYGTLEDKKAYEEYLENEKQSLYLDEDEKKELTDEMLSNPDYFDETTSTLEDIEITEEEAANETSNSIEENLNYITTVEELNNSTVVLTNLETKEVQEIASTDGVASWVFLIPAGITLSQTAMAHLIAAGSAVVIGSTAALALSKLSSSSSNRKNYDHFKVVKVNNKLYSTGGMKMDAAAKRMSTNGDVWSISQGKAKTVAQTASKKAGGTYSVIGAETHAQGRKGYYSHYHTNPRKVSSGHSFFGTESK